MKTGRFLILLLGLAASGSAFAWGHGGVRFGFYVGVPIGAPYWYYPPYAYPYPYYYPPVVSVASPPVYVEQPGGAAQPAPAPAPAQNYWYYCAASKAYYPYVKECAGGWQRVAPQPPS